MKVLRLSLHVNFRPVIRRPVVVLLLVVVLVVLFFVLRAVVAPLVREEGSVGVCGEAQQCHSERRAHRRP